MAGSLSETSLTDKARRIRLVGFDVDGVLTDGRLYMGPDGLELKVFHTRDGHGLKALMRHGIEVAVISGRHSQAVEARMQQLGIRHLHLGVEDKAPCFEQIRQSLELPPEACAFMGDDVVDLGVMNNVALAAAPADAHPTVQAMCHWQSRQSGGFGAAREWCDRILTAQGHSDEYAGN
ncbi:3-deoxy-D-manno-octulosonate 8-phosphate phosphatase (KDO 8-P phosphatase) [Natronospira proteinivora]|uniref:3-deoxy-D-manno-octulosonate 8-phosphate phosphatase KdsC n=1 Tax=Natronospira proteinivora TaxID=1807133 RepID=A0ABT1G6V1_9GAMM|nr:HAD family hydrolase [Natronospira proteinivora]MCP1726078.1 3-deoxy-D-manno-octulosonate 8-phosphate phosphatase (KDO 8-P phosphatase) [Natronospira proteinivora]